MDSYNFEEFRKSVNGFPIQLIKHISKDSWKSYKSAIRLYNKINIQASLIKPLIKYNSYADIIVYKIDNGKKKIQPYKLSPHYDYISVLPHSLRGTGLKGFRKYRGKYYPDKCIIYAVNNGILKNAKKLYTILELMHPLTKKIYYKSRNSNEIIKI